jgi:RNA-directed DNA polymerase
MIGKRTLGSPLREICTMGSERGDGHKGPCSLGEGTGSKESDYSEAPQRATASRPVPTHQADFLGFSYGFRPGRSQHDALDALAFGITRTKVNYVLDCDVRSFFDSVSHDWLVRFLEHRIGDPRVIRLIRKWLKAGVMEDGKWEATEVGTPQGSVASPLLANVYLHYCFDLWAERWRHREAHGNVIYVRFADDIVVGFEHEADAERFRAALRERMEKFGLALHPEKTRLIEFGSDADRDRSLRGLGKPETFDFLGFTHICGRSRRGFFQLKRKTQRKRMRAKLRALKVELRRRMHEPIPEQGRWLAQVVRGYFAYHAVPTNFRRLSAFRYYLGEQWLRTLRARSQKDRATWQQLHRLMAAFLPIPRIRHPWPETRFLDKYPRWKPSARIGPARFCAGGM